MPRPGGEADKLGNRYESLWTVDAAFDLIDGKYTDLTVEAVGDEAAGVEFVLSTPSGTREFHSIKRQHADGNWTISRLAKAGATGRSILGDLIAKVRGGDSAVFSSGTSATQLEELTDRARASDSVEEFRQRIDASGRLSGLFADRIVPLCDHDERAAWVALQRLDIRITNERMLTTNVERRVDSMLRAADGQPIDSREVRLLLGDVLTESLGKRHTASSVLEALARHGLSRSLLVGEATVNTEIQRLNRAHLTEVHALLINREEIVREEGAFASATLVEQGKSVVLEGTAGSGKTFVLAQLMERLTEEGVPCLVIRLDRLTVEDHSSKALGTRLGLPSSPAITLGEFAGNQPSVLVIDQLDALSVVSARNQAAWGVFNELLDEARSYPNLRLLLACRSFDLERDPRLRALVTDQGQVERVALQPLEEDVVRLAVATAGLDPTSLSAAQIEILATPLHLHLLLESATSDRMEFTSAGDLYDAFWEHKSVTLSQRLPGMSSAWTDAVAYLTDELSSRQSLVAPSFVMDRYRETLNLLQSEGVVNVQNDNVGFFHESFFDYAFARGFVRSNKDLVQWLLDDEQHLFRRSQVRQVLTFLRDRESDRSTYLRVIGGLLSHPEIRFHIKKLVLDWLGALPDPTLDEWQAVERLAEQLNDHAWAVARNSVPWFDTLHAMGRWEVWLRADGEQADRALWLLRMPDVLAARSGAVAGLVRGFRGTSEEWDRRLQGLIEGRHGRTSSEMQDLVVDLIGDGVLDEARPRIAVNDDWWSTWYGLGGQQPEFGVRVLGAWFDRQLARAAAVDKVDPFEYGLSLVAHSQSSGGFIRECAERAPLEFAKALFPRFARFDLRVPKMRITAPSQGGSPDNQLRDALGDAMRTVAREDPATLDSLIEGEPHGESRWMTALLLQAWSANPDAYAEHIVRFLLESPEQRLDIGYDMAAGGTDMLAAFTRAAIAAASPRCADKSFADLESAILGFVPEWEQQHRFVGRTALALLRALDENRLSERARRRIRELERRFPEAPERGTPRPPSPDDDEGGLVGSPIAATDQRHMTDAQWLAAMARYQDEGLDWTHGKEPVGGAIELSRGLEQLAREDPNRFARLAQQMDGSQNPAYFSAILRGLTEVRGTERPATCEQVCSVVRHIAEVGVTGIEGTLADAIGTLADEDIPQDVVRMLSDIANEATDPREDDWLDGQDRDPEMAPITQAINSDRGRAAQALARLLFADRERWLVLKPTVERLIVDPVLAVRSVAVGCLLSVLDTHREEALAGFGRLIDGAGPILGSRHIERFVHFAVYRDYPSIRPTLLTMLESSEPVARKVGARQMTLASLSVDEASEDADLVLSLGEDARVGAASVFGKNVADATIGAECEERLQGLFADESEAVRREAARCWEALDPDEIARRGALLIAYVRSIGPDADVTTLTHELERSQEPLPVEVCELAERAVAAYGRKAGDIWGWESAVAYDLASLVMRLHEETSDPSLRRRVLDVIEDMLRAGFMGMGDRVGEQYDR